MAVPVFGWIAKKILGTRNQRMVKRYLGKVDQINAFEPEITVLTDPELKARSTVFRERLAAGELADDLMAEIFAVAREAMDRAVGIRNIFDPDHGFDPSLLPADAQALYADVAATIAKTPDAEPEGDLLGCTAPVPAWLFVDIPPALYAAVRDLHPMSKPPFRARPFDVQLIGGTVLSEGRIAEMKTGEGKTIVGPMACYLACLQDKQVHVVTVNDYLVQRDRDWTFPFFYAIGLTVGSIHPYHMQPPDTKKKMYDCNVVYGTTSEFGFDYLRDNMKLRAEDQVQKHRQFAIVDEVDSTLIDEARTPLIISGPAHSVKPRYELADGLATHLVSMQGEWSKADDKVQSSMVTISGLEGDIRNSRDKAATAKMKDNLEAARESLPSLEEARDNYTQFFEVELDKKSATLTHEGTSEAQRKAGIGSFYVGDNIDLPHLVEQAVRARVVYQRDRDYVIAADEQGQMTVVIVDQNTGRKMVGRQWSDGLHQAVEAKENVPIKEETQTMATITIQNFFKMYERLAGMTGTADTEATEFHEIYRLDVVSIPTNVPVVRSDRNDLVFLSEGDKWDSIVDEIKRFYDLGRPVLVGTTSVERSEMLSKMLTKKYRIPHEVLNAKQHEREADIVLNAGQLGAIMIATNMAGRGTDIKLGAINREHLIDHWKTAGICPKDVRPDMSDEEVFDAAWRHMAQRDLGLTRGDVAALEPSELRRQLMVKWATELAWLDEAKAEKMSVSALEAALDGCGSCLMHRLSFETSVQDLGGLHIIGTERHESRRIDNQLRGRSGRQGDTGSSRFFLSLEDDLMKMFAGKKTLYILSKLGMKEGDAIEHPMLSRSVENAQRKVEERNFQIRKNILDYDEPMEFQRQRFYSTRQPILEGKNVKTAMFQYINDAVHGEAQSLLTPEHQARSIAEWVRETHGIMIEPDRLQGKDRDDLHALIRSDYLEETSSIMLNTANEYLNDDIEREEWDVDGFAKWAKEEYGANVDSTTLRERQSRDVIREVEQAAAVRFDSTDLTPLDRYLVAGYGVGELVSWMNNRFGTTLDPEAITTSKDADTTANNLLTEARKAYRTREIEYPVDFAMDMTLAGIKQNPVAALQQLCSWANSRYGLNWSPSALPDADPQKLREILYGHANKWDDARVHERAVEATSNASTPEDLDAWFQKECLVALSDEEKVEAAGDLVGFTEQRITELLRSEVTQFERWVLLQILDTVWKDHLHSMDQIRDSIGFRAFSQRDPRIEFKREAANLFEEFFDHVRDRVTDVAFKGKLAPQAAARIADHAAAADGPSNPGTPASPQASPTAPAKRTVAAATAMLAEAQAASGQGTAEQRRDIEIAEQAGRESDTTTSKAKPQRTKARGPAIGRNEIVAVVDPSSGDRIEMKWKKAQPLVKQGWKLVN
jgi:preprotein translocase subunit SecA